MSIGIDYNTFWSPGFTPRKAKAFVEAFKKKQEMEIERFKHQTNLSAWLHGRYVLDAIGAAVSKNARYPKEPIKIDRQDRNPQQMKERFNALRLTINQRKRRARNEPSG